MIRLGSPGFKAVPAVWGWEMPGLSKQVVCLLFSFERVILYQSVIGTFLSSRIGLSSASNPRSTGCLASSGNHFSTWSFILTRPCSTSCSAATAIKSLVCDASRKMASSWKSSACFFAEILPTAWLYLKLPRIVDVLVCLFHLAGV